jgi:hypothetical protein
MFKSLKLLSTYSLNLSAGLCFWLFWFFWSFLGAFYAAFIRTL